VRLLYLTDRLSDRGGADHHLEQVIGASIAAGHRVTIGFGRDDGGLRCRDGAKLERVKGLSTMVESSRRLDGLGRLLAAADVVHAQNIMNPTALGVIVGHGRTVVTVQDHRVFCPGPGKTLPDGSACPSAMMDELCSRCVPGGVYLRRTLELTRRRLAALAGAAVVVLSRYMADELEKVGVADALVVPPWVEVGPERLEAGMHFLLGGRLVEHKGVVDGWRAWSGAGRPLPLKVAGSGPLEPELVGAEPRGWLDSEDLRHALRRARALLFPARWQEPFGILGLEALAQGTPVVVAECGGTAEWSGSGCLRVPPGDVPAMTAAIERLARDPEFALDLGRAGRAAIGEVFVRERIAPMLDELYRRVASS
jgi:hypothetical protein